MKLQYWIMACAASAAAAFAGCSYHQAARQYLAPRQTGFGFFFVDELGQAKLAYGAPDSDDVGLMMECAKGSRLVRVSDLVRSSPAPLLVLTSGGARSELKAETSPGMGQLLVMASAPSGAAALQGFRRSGRIEVAYAGLRYAVAATAADRPAVERFFTACEGRRA